MHYRFFVVVSKDWILIRQKKLFFTNIITAKTVVAQKKKTLALYVVYTQPASERQSSLFNDGISWTRSIIHFLLNSEIKNQIESQFFDYVCVWAILKEEAQQI